MESLVISVHVLAAIAIIGLVLLQQGKGADMGASFGSGASQTIFGSSGSGNVLTKATTWLAVIFFLTSLFLAYVARQQADSGTVQSSLIENADRIETLTPPSDDDLPQAPVGGESDLPQTGTEQGEVPQGATSEQPAEAVEENAQQGAEAGETPQAEDPSAEE